ncbi:hypothetical protein HBH56_234010 [Parastagonospora nodorum]|uniref:Uncharacterized protein n=1 Tax=Phaeosphaeria nodorum (strain SN15 / ATCC MYA-4574 / FGSC 10173) TaxID=321614 RepID=A0A7U2F3P9_PHANO|nr:hypothetical protein HBH56_234010 [Parastagonospora nodorum]QRC97053.1 hypothetical protein JI435_140510 [Parastagonospora nodorum SN15]KAH3921334.1 hypothetical protein HBH54_242070 [Parastagonospora nodorum]KAH3944667.1 hypothetical protein HBH53_158180 [Parastagonospora nodorum]KAH3959367.1 hypothetical protein HBH52_244980 [Parastagonospora nodorum]
MSLSLNSSFASATTAVTVTSTSVETSRPTLFDRCSTNSVQSGVQNITGLEGQEICLFNYPPSLFQAAHCCKNPNDVRVEKNCTQYCAINGHDVDAYFKCVRNDYKRQKNSTSNFLGLCYNVTDKKDDEGAATSMATYSLTLGAVMAGMTMCLVSFL